MALTYVALFVPFTVQYVSSSLGQINPALVQAGRVFGASPAYALRRITLPLVARGIAAGWVMTFIISLRELVASSMIAPPCVLTVSTFIVREFEQGSVSVGMAMAVVCVLLTTGTLAALRCLTGNK